MEYIFSYVFKDKINYYNDSTNFVREIINNELTISRNNYSEVTNFTEGTLYDDNESIDNELLKKSKFEIKNRQDKDI